MLVFSGLLVGLSAIWMTLTYPRADGTGELLYASRLLFGMAMIGAIVCGYVEIRRGRVSRHRAWMTRAFALGLAAGTQMLILLVWELVAGAPDVLGGDVLRVAGWIVNLALAEWVLLRGPQMVRRKGGGMVVPLR